MGKKSDFEEVDKLISKVKVIVFLENGSPNIYMGLGLSDNPEYELPHNLSRLKPDFNITNFSDLKNKLFNLELKYLSLIDKLERDKVRRDIGIEIWNFYGQYPSIISDVKRKTGDIPYYDKILLEYNYILNKYGPYCKNILVKMIWWDKKEKRVTESASLHLSVIFKHMRTQIENEKEYEDGQNIIDKKSKKQNHKSTINLKYLTLEDLKKEEPEKVYKISVLHNSIEYSKATIRNWYEKGYSVSEEQAKQWGKMGYEVSRSKNSRRMLLKVEKVGDRLVTINKDLIAFLEFKNKYL